MQEVIYFFIPLIVAGYMINFLSLRTPLKHFYQLIVRPGVIIHEAGHYLACKVTFAEVKQVSLFAKDGGFVKHTPSPIPVLGSFIISLAPLVAGALVIIVLGQKLGFADQISSSQFNLKDIIALFKNNFNLYFLIYLYAILAIGSTLTPSTQDLENCFIALIIVLAILYYFRKTVFVQHLLASLVGLMPLVVYPLVLVVLIILVIFLVSKILKIG